MDSLTKKDLSQEFKPETQWFKKLVHKLIPKGLRKPIFVTLLITHLIYGALTFVGVKLGVINFNFQTFNTSLSNQSGIQQFGNSNSVVLAEKTQCLSRYCSDFRDKKWLGIDKFIIIQEEPLILKSPSTLQLPGATMFFNESVGNFISTSFVTPQASSSANLVFSYGHFYRCILGDSDYEQISCQINQGYPNVPEQWAYIDQSGIIYGKYQKYQTRPFEMNKELEVRFEQREDSNNTIISIKINNQVPADWILPKDYQKKTLRENIGLGLITNKYNDAQGVFKHFELEPQP